MFSLMVRKPRLDVPGGVYQVLASGNRCATIFHDDADYHAYLERRERYGQRNEGTVHASVLMTNRGGASSFEAPVQARSQAG